MWTDIELRMALALGAILKADNPASVALFLAIRTSPTRREALSAISRLLLTGNDLDAFEALLIVYQSLEKQRNALAHGVFGYSDSIPDALLWDSIQNHADFLLNVYVAEYKGTPLPDPHERLRKNMFVYRRKDLEEFLQQLTELQKAASCFHSRHQPRPGMTHDYLKDIFSLPQIQQALKSLTSNRGTTEAQTDV
jgi:hypothetical protein